MPTNWRQYAVDEVGNRGIIPEGGYPGPRVNNDVRELGATARNLGDETPKIDAAKGMTGETKIGTAALRDETYFVRAGASTGGSGTPTAAFGIVPLGAVIPFFGSLSQAEALLSSGYGVCDGRRVVNPATGAANDLPDLREAYLRWFGNNVSPGSSGGSATGTGAATLSGTTGSSGSGTTSSSGAGTTGSDGAGTTGSGGAGTTGSGGSGTTGSTVLTKTNMPADMPVAIALNSSPNNGATEQAANGTDKGLNTTLGGGVGHTHTEASHTHSTPAHTHSVPDHTHSVPAHTHTTTAHTHSFSASAAVSVPLVPVYRAVIPLMRIA